MRRGGVERGAEVKGDMRGRKGGNAKEKQELGKGEERRREENGG